MRDLLLQSGDLNVSIPSTTSAQHAIAVVVVAVLLLGSLVWYWRSKTFGLDESNKRNREDARAQKRRQTPALLQYASTDIREGIDGLTGDVDALFDVESHETRTTLWAASSRVYRAVSVAWADRVAGIPRLARRGFWLAAWVSLLGAVAVSTGLVVRLLSADAPAPDPASVFDLVNGAVAWLTGAVTAFPFAGVLWKLSFAYSILFSTWAYNQWYLVAGGLAASAVAIVLLTRRLDDAAVPDHIVRHRGEAAGTALTSVVLVWLTGAGVATVGEMLPPLEIASIPVIPEIMTFFGLLVIIYAAATDTFAFGTFLRVAIATTALAVSTAVDAIGVAAWPSLLGFLLSVWVAFELARRYVPRAVRRIRRGVRRVAGEQSREAAAFVVAQRTLSVLSVVGVLLIVLYLVASVAGGDWARVGQAFLDAAPEVQATLAGGVLGLLGLGAYAVAASWPDVRAELHGVFAEQAVRAQLVRRALPTVVVFFAYVFLWNLSQRIVVALAAALVIGLLVQKAALLATEASYRADWQGITRRFTHPEPAFVNWLAYDFDVAGERYYVLEVNGRTLLSDDRSEVVLASVDVARALATNEDPPATDVEWFADFVLEYGIVEREDWEAKLDEKIRIEVFNTLRDRELPFVGRTQSGGRVRREEMERALDEFSDERVQRRFYDSDIHPYVTVSDEWVSLNRDPYEPVSRREWPSFDD
jgi:hypothetical protein